MDFVNFLNINSGAIQAFSTTVQAVSTAVLVLITAFYAWETYKTNKLIYRQVSPNITFKVLNLKSTLPNKDHVQEIQKSKGNPGYHSYNIRFVLTYSVINQSASAGTIDKPELILICPDQNQVVIPVSKKTGAANFYKTGDSPSEILAAQKLWEMNEALKDTIYLLPGEKKNLEEVYCRFFSCERPQDDLAQLLNNANEINYKISYLNENGQRKLIAIDNDKIQIEKFD